MASPAYCGFLFGGTPFRKLLPPCRRLPRELFQLHGRRRPPDVPLRAHFEESDPVLGRQFIGELRGGVDFRTGERP
jgi:hypothetical protein